MDEVKVETQVEPTYDFGKMVEMQKGLVIGLASGVAIAALASLFLGGWLLPVILGVVLGAVIGVNVRKAQLA